MSSEGVNRLEKSADAHKVGCSFLKLHTGLEVIQSAKGGQSLCGCHSVMGCICSFAGATTAIILAAI